MRELKAGELRRTCNPTTFSFKTTSELPFSGEEVLIDQERARAALKRALGLSAVGFNAYVFGPRNVGCKTLVRQIIAEVAPTRPPGSDLCYVCNFDDSQRPKALLLPAGQARMFADRMRVFVGEIPKLVESILMSSTVEQLVIGANQEAEGQVDEAQAEFVQDVRKAGFFVGNTVAGLALFPDPKLSTPKEIPVELRIKLARMVRLKEQVTDDGSRRVSATVRELVREDIILRLAPLMLICAPVEEFLRRVAVDVSEHFGMFIDDDADAELFGRRYAVNVLVEAGTAGAPVVFEANPTYANLIGEIEHTNVDGRWLTDHAFIRPGALHQANGGFLVLEVRSILIKPFAWDALKRALKTEYISLEPIGREFAVFPVKTLQPEPVSLNVKVVLFGEPKLFALLEEHDPEFSDLFKIRVEFESDMTRTSEGENAYGAFIRVRQEEIGILPCDPGAVARIVEYGSRLAGGQERLSLRFGHIDTLLQEASFVASERGHAVITTEDVRRALKDRVHRRDYLETLLRRQISEGTHLVDTSGEQVGQLNGLVVYAMTNDYSFGSSVRITARTWAGTGNGSKVVHIDRDVELSGPTHNKGVMILTGYLGWKYGQERTFSLLASITFEQSYGKVDGDSASAAELYTLLSSLSKIPLWQGVAVTGSMNQHGQIQPVGGINVKIEGFFDVCRVMGELTGKQGVIIPAANVKHLMLREDVVDAVRKGQFHVWAISTLDEGLELLTGKSAGEIHKLVAKRLTGRKRVSFWKRFRSS